MCQHPELLAQVQAWIVAEWPAWYGPGGPGNAAADVAAFAASATALPVGLVIFENGTAVGAGAIKAQSIPSHAHLGPWAGAGYVLPSHRGRGLGAALLQGLVAHAQTLGHATMYCATATARTLLLRCGWQWLEDIEHDGQRLGIYRSLG